MFPLIYEKTGNPKNWPKMIQWYTQFEIYYTNYSVYLQNIKASMLL